MRAFVFYRTFVPVLSKDTPVTVGFERVSPSLLSRIRGFKHVWMHSGNWWNIPASRRTPDRLLDSLRKLAKVAKVEGFMSINVPPLRVRKHYDIWNYPQEIRYAALQRSFELALEIRDKLDLEVPLYCCYEVGRFDDAYLWYGKAAEAGFDRFGAGFAAFLMGRPLPQAYERIVEVIIAARAACGYKVPFHASGVGSLRLLALVYYAGATSADGSTPIRAALALRTIYDLSGKGYRVDRLREWHCSCSFCKNYSPKELASLMRNNYKARVLHNSEIWNSFISRMIKAYEEGRFEEFLHKVLAGSKAHMRAYLHAKSLLKKYHLG